MADRLTEFTNTLTRDEVRVMYDLLKRRARRLDEEALDSGRLRVGSKVVFVGRRGRLVTGVVEGLNNRTVSVLSSDGVRWRVQPSVLELRQF